MFSWLKGIFSDTETFNDTLDKGLEMIDDSSFTKEEKSRARFQLLEVIPNFLVKLKFMSRARRVLAYLITGEYILLINIGVIGLAFGAADFADTIFGDILLGRMQVLVNIVVGFYFFTGILKGTGK